MDIDLHEIIIELIEAAKKSSKNNSEIWADYSLAESYPEGEEAYFKKRAYEIRKNIYDETFIGRKWVEDKCRLDILETDWMGRAMTVFVSNDIMKYYAWKDLRIFIERILQLLVYEDMIKKRESESKQGPMNKRLSLQEKALISVYEGELILRDEGKLYQHFLYYSPRTNRIGTDGSRKKTLNKITRIEKIIPLLSISAQKIAIDEVNTLKSALEKELF
jgi:hypothetical protein